MFLISSFGIQARGIQTPNVMISVLIAFGGICQYLVGIFEFVSGNTFGATVFTSYGAFNLSYGMIYLPGTGIAAAYTDAQTGALSRDFGQSISLYLWAWFILTVIFTIAALRSSWILLLDLAALDVCLLLLAVGYMAESQSVLTAGYAFGYVVAFLSCKSPCPNKQSRIADSYFYLHRLVRLRRTLCRRHYALHCSRLPPYQGRLRNRQRQLRHSFFSIKMCEETSPTCYTAQCKS